MNRYLFVVSSVFAAILLCAGGVHAEIYKTVDEDGNVVFTDVAPKDQTKAITIETQNSYTPETSESPAPSGRRAEEAEEDEAPAAVMYDQIAILAPQNDEAIRENTGNVTVVVASNPALDSGRGHVLQILVDGQPAGSGQSNSVALTNLDRGTHQITAQIVDSSGQVIATSSPVTFHMLRYSALMRRASGS